MLYAHRTIHILWKKIMHLHIQSRWICHFTKMFNININSWWDFFVQKHDFHSDFHSVITGYQVVFGWSPIWNKNQKFLALAHKIEHKSYAAWLIGLMTNLFKHSCSVSFVTFTTFEWLQTVRRWIEKKAMKYYWLQMKNMTR